MMLPRHSLRYFSNYKQTLIKVFIVFSFLSSCFSCVNSLAHQKSVLAITANERAVPLTELSSKRSHQHPELAPSNLQPVAPSAITFLAEKTVQKRINEVSIDPIGDASISLSLPEPVTTQNQQQTQRQMQPAGNIQDHRQNQSQQQPQDEQQHQHNLHQIPNFVNQQKQHKRHQRVYPQWFLEHLVPPRRPLVVRHRPAQGPRFTNLASKSCSGVCTKQASSGHCIQDFACLRKSGR